MDLHVFLKVPRLTEPSTAGCADVGSLSCVKSAMDNHFIPGGEGFPTKLTAVRPRVRVNALVFSQQIPSLKVLRAEGTLEWSLMSVNTSNMKQKLSLPRVP